MEFIKLLGDGKSKAEVKSIQKLFKDLKDDPINIEDKENEKTARELIE